MDQMTTRVYAVNVKDAGAVKVAEYLLKHRQFSSFVVAALNQYGADNPSSLK